MEGADQTMILRADALGTSLLREDFDPLEVSLVAILDDKESSLRPQDSLIQTIGRTARHLECRAILYAGKMTNSIQRALDEPKSRSAIAFNVKQ